MHKLCDDEGAPKLQEQLQWSFYLNTIFLEKINRGNQRLSEGERKLRFATSVFQSVVNIEEGSGDISGQLF